MFREAAALAGGLSRAVSEALRDYVRRRRIGADGLQEIELDLQHDGVSHRVSFIGRRLVRIQRPVDEGTRIDRVFLTAKQQFAVATKVLRQLPDRAHAREEIWSDPRTWNNEFWTTGDRTLTVYSTLAELQQADPEIGERVEAALQIVPIETLDI